MTVPFAALSIHNFVNSVGAYVGLGSIVAVALLVLLYFAHARETATLRDRLDESQQRIGGLESRIAQIMQAQAATARRVPAPVPSPVLPGPAPVRAGAAPAPAPAGAQRRGPSPATAAGGASAPAAGLAAAAANANGRPAVTWAPAGTAAPALASATKLIPDPATVGGVGDPEDTMFVSAATVAATNGQTAAARQTAAAAPLPVAASPSPPAPPGGVQAGRRPGPVARPGVHARAARRRCRSPHPGCESARRGGRATTDADLSGGRRRGKRCRRDRRRGSSAPNRWRQGPDDGTGAARL